LYYHLSSLGTGYFGCCIVFMINAMPHATALAYAAPRELLIGRKLDFKRDIRFEFGDYVQARVPNLVNNSLYPDPKAV